MAKVTAGQIAFWFGTLLTIPDGWLLCDGNNGTPNLLDSFLIGAGGGGSFSPDDSGGDINHTHDFTGDGHIHTISEGTGLAAVIGSDNNTDTGIAAGTTNPDGSLPPYHALLPIMLT